MQISILTAKEGLRSLDGLWDNLMSDRLIEACSAGVIF